MDRKNVSIWCPSELPDGAFYFISATHRGDMYHVRVAMQLNPLPLYLYDCQASTQQLEQYLDLSQLPGQLPVVRVPWTWETLSNRGKAPVGGPAAFGPIISGKPFDPSEMRIRTTDILSEGSATLIIADQLKTGGPAIPDRIRAAVAIISDARKAAVRVALEKLLPTVFSNIPADRNNVLILHRDTGASSPTGAYPELDSGVAINQLAKMLRDFPKDCGGALIPILCGNPVADPAIPGIGKYWEKLRIPEVEGERMRDIEAFFLQIAKEKGYFSMVVGFRSGVMDLFTFLGVPTASIGLKDMVGESRHDRLALPQLMRMNVKYALPRHPATAWFISDRKDEPKTLFGSPFWDFTKAVPQEIGGDPAKLAAAKLTRANAPGEFSKFDNRVVSDGVWMAASKYLFFPGKPVAVYQALKWRDPIDIYNNHFDRFCLPLGWGLNLPREQQTLTFYFGAVKMLEDADMKKRRERKDAMMETDAIYDSINKELKNDWEDVMTRAAKNKPIYAKSPFG